MPSQHGVAFQGRGSGSCRIDKGLVQEESPFKASREFGISYMTSKGECASIGTVMRIQDFAKVGNDGQMLISNTGDDRWTLDPKQGRPTTEA